MRKYRYDPITEQQVRDRAHKMVTPRPPKRPINIRRSQASGKWYVRYDFYLTGGPCPTWQWNRIRTGFNTLAHAMNWVYKRGPIS